MNTMMNNTEATTTTNDKTCPVKKYISWSILITFFALLFGVLLPFSVGKIIKLSLPKKIALLNQHALSSCNIKLIDLKSGIYESVANLEIHYTLNNGKVIPIKLSQKLRHGPLILEVKNRTLHFKLAKIYSQVQLLNSEQVKFEPELINFASFLEYNGKLVVEEELPTFLLSIKSAVSQNAWMQVKVENAQLNANLNLFSSDLQHTIKVKNLCFSDDRNILRFEFTGFSVQAAYKFSDINENVCSSFDHLRVTQRGREILAIQSGNLKNLIQKNLTQNFHDVALNLNLKNMILFGRVFGPLSAELVFHDLNLKKYHEFFQKKLNNQNSNFLVLKDFLKTEALDIEFKDISFQIPEGQMTAKGKMKFHPEPHTHKNANALPNYTGTFSLAAPKKGLQDLTAVLIHGFRELSQGNGIPQVELINAENPASAENLGQYKNYVAGLFDAFINDGVMIDAGSEYLCHCLYRNNKLYINGSCKTDAVSRNNLTQFKPPYTPEQQLQFAIWMDDIEQVRLLLKQGVDPNRTLPGIKNPLHSAAHLGNLEIAKLLLESKVEVNQIDHSGATPLYWATRAGHANLVKLFLEQGAYADTKNAEGWTPLQEAAENGFPEIVELLLSKGANINAQDNDGRTALFWAARQGQQEVIRLLLNKGANPELRNVRGLNAAEVAEEYGFPDAAKLLR